MGRDNYSVRLPDDLRERLDQFIDDRDISQSEGMKRVLDTGLQQYGYDDHGRSATTLKRASWVGTGALGVVAASWAIMAQWFDVQLLGPILMCSSLALALLAVASIEPRLTKAYRRRRSNDTASSQRRAVADGGSGGDD